MQKYCIGSVEARPTFYTFEGEFYPTLKKRVSAYFKKTGLEHRDAPSMYIKTALILAGWFVSYYYGVVQGHLLGAMVLGFMSMEIGVSVMHDGNHGAYSSKAWVNKVTGWGLDFIGASGFCWEFQHVLGHHPYTNLGGDSSAIEADPDVFSSYPLMRMHTAESMPPMWYHRFQHIYGPVLFALFTMSKVFTQDFSVAMSGKQGETIVTDSRFSNAWNVLRFYGMKALSCGYMLGVPLYLHGISWGLTLFVAAHLVAGETLALMFIVTHITEGCSYMESGKGVSQPAKQKDVTSPELAKWKQKETAAANDWAALQCRSSVNWAADSWLWTHLSGGLNHQIEHHLFPGISHVHYPALRPLVKQTCAEFGVPYLEHPSLTSAMGAMLRHLRTIGQPSAVVA